jgi:two-component system, chemotaxis family, protein-glutamate methylesterase/glutaminase
MTQPSVVHVLVVDDSAVVRQVLRELISSEPGMRVQVAGDPLIAESKMRRQRPDVIILDLELPVMDGLSWLRRLMAQDPLPVIVCSAQVGDAAIPAIRALEEGAIEVVTKPRLGVRDFLVESREPLLEAIRAAVGARVALNRPCGPSPVLERPRALERPRVPLRAPAVRPDSAERLIAIGASTGGPQALEAILSTLPADCPPILIAQHMPGAFTPAFARRLDELCAISVREAADGEEVGRGTALIAPGGRHLKLRPGRPGTPYRVDLDDGPTVCGHRPSVDVLFTSVARRAGAQACGVVLTGMGCDGASGLLAMRQAGATTLAESEESCVVYGMPRAALELGGAQTSLAVSDIARRLCGFAREAGAAAGESRDGA